MATYIVIPARYQSTRLPGKALVDIGGKPMIQHVYERSQSAGIGEVIIATDDQRIVAAAEKFGAKVCLTSAKHQSGTERISEVIEKFKFADDDIIVCVQGDEPLIPSGIIKQVADNLASEKIASVATLCEPIDDMKDIFNLQINKVIMDNQGYAIYFSHTPIPWYRDGFTEHEKKLPQDFQYYRHIGIYAYRAGFVKRYVSWEPSPIEQIEKLEQLRILWYGEKIHVAIAVENPGPGVDTPEDLAMVCSLIAGA
jgi:3-deoxy-manno-octulosonate cytidylyltransferase (CMP-KDO synthetase)